MEQWLIMWSGVQELRAMYVIEPGEEVISLPINFDISSLWKIFFSMQTIRLNLQFVIFQVNINYLPMAEEGGEVREVRQKYLR